MDPAIFARRIYDALENHPEGLTTINLEKETGLTRNQFSTGRKLLQKRQYGKHQARLIFLDEDNMRWQLTMLPEQAMHIALNRLDYLCNHFQVEMRICDRLIDEHGTSEELEKLGRRALDLLRGMTAELEELLDGGGS